MIGKVSTKKLGIRTASLLVNTYEYVTIKLYSACENACLLACKTIPFRLSVHSLKIIVTPGCTRTWLRVRMYPSDSV